ncbi:MAG TPA: hypothetical protein VF123_11505 [Candidatus Sulfotelmatobacter sp.]
MAQDVGDAVLHFLGDSTDLDTKLDRVAPDTERAFGKAADAVEEGTGRMKNSLGEARGEAALLGEAFGIHLPRHVRSFLAELPGVNQALSAAFSATAVLFVANAVVELSKKLSEAVAEFVYANSVWDEAQKSVVGLNTELMGLEKEYAALKKQADDYGKSQLQLASEQRGEVKQSVQQLNKELQSEIEQFKALTKAENEHTKTRLGAVAAWDAWKSGNLGALQALKAFTLGIDTATLHQKQHDEIENKIITTHQKLQNAQQQLRVSTNNVATAQAELNAKGAALDIQIAKTANQLNDLIRAMNRTKREASELEIVTPAQIRNILNGIAAAHNFSIVLRQDLWQALQDAKKAEDDFAKSGINDGVALKQLQKNVADAQKALDNYGKSVDTFKLRSHGMWKEFRDDAKAGATTLDQVKQIGVTAFDDMSKGFEAAIQSEVLAQGSFVAGLQKATASALASIASQAIIKSLFYTAEGFAALAGFNHTSAGQYFIAAGEMAAVGAAAGIAGHALAGGSGGGGNGDTRQTFGSVSNTSQNNRSVPHLAEGGLITGPTLAVLGEDRKKPTEAVMNLDDPRAMKKVGQAIGEHGGANAVFNINGGLISDSNVIKLMGKMSKIVLQGKGQLHASNSLRITKRSA